ncbi:Methyltransferase domain-containing protein [Mucilaginibacter pineti]|uniref:Methyltransferase domain-containing protein n=1 Tax=Mucilaginibacter pineti TaxID=1391627 RepID=A0A1G6TBZ6_9SPHI|nr:class I SAM-dependent methyltransferase [Mucilaginibacter pineti]SDD26549.1 Methyltransferase domain-containing protein [Mucilaginibacter pineti]
MGNCKICDDKLGDAFPIREMMLGTREEFNYAQCTGCGTIQILNIPGNIGNYYPNYYYSFHHKIPALIQLPLFKRIFKDIRIKKKYRQKDTDIFNYLRPIQTLASHKILDIGCGSGKLICEMFNLGFQNVQGTDKFIEAGYDYGYGVKVFKKDLSELKKKSYNLLMMHHVFEHMDNPAEELVKCHRLLKDDGHLIIRIPVVGKAWDIYKTDWIQLDAPRHFFLHTVASMKILAGKAGFVIDNVIYDSTAFQFWGSELYKRDIPFVNENKEYRLPTDYYSTEELDNYEQLASGLNKEQQGDSAIFYLTKRR